MVGQDGVGALVDALKPQGALHLGKTLLGGRDGALGLVEFEVLALAKTRHHGGEAAEGLGGAPSPTRDDERGARLVDEDGVDLVHDGEGVPALHAVGGGGGHVAAQVVEAELRGGAVGDVGRVGGLALLGAHAVLHEACGHPHEAVDASDLLGVATRQVVVGRDHVHPAPGDGVQVARQRGDERLALARAHLGDLPVVQRHAADELDVEVAHPKGAQARLADGGEGLGQERIEALPRRVALAKLRGQRRELLI